MHDIITLDYGSGGKKTSSLIEDMILPLMGNDTLGKLGDGAVLKGSEKLVFSTDSFVIAPYFFPGGDIGKLSVCGTVNDIAMAGGEPRFLSLSLILEEGLPVRDLEMILESVSKTAKKAGVQVVTGDTKVVERGRGDGIYINTAGIGYGIRTDLGTDKIEEGDVVILSGTSGDHGTAVMLARNPELMQGELSSDCACLHEMARELYGLEKNLKILRDPTRGGIATTLNEFTEGNAFSIELQEDCIPVAGSVRSACEMLGLDPYYCANEGKLLAVVAPEVQEQALEMIRSFPEGKNAEIIGRVCKNHPGKVILKTPYGSRILTKLTGSQLPRIC